MRAYVFAVVLAVALGITPERVSSQDAKSEFTRFVAGKDLLDHLISPQGPHVWIDDAWWRLVRKENPQVGVVYFLWNDNGVPVGRQGPSSTVFTTVVVTTKDGGSPRVNPPNGGCKEFKGEPGKSPWDYGGWKAYRNFLIEVAKDRVYSSQQASFCTKESDIRFELEKKLKDAPKAYSAAALRLILDQVDKELQIRDANLANAIDKVFNTDTLAATIVQNSGFLDALLKNEAFVSALKQRLQQP